MGKLGLSLERFVVIVFLSLFWLQCEWVDAHIIGGGPLTSQFEFLKHIEGCQKGDTTKDINKLKKYLKRFGYFERYHNVTTAKSAETYEGDHFDETTERAVKDYQRFYGLNVTGALNSETVSKMMEPRCGYPDIIKEGHTLEPAYAFLGQQKYKWAPSKRHLKYFFEAQTPAHVILGVPSAFQSWQNLSGVFTFSETQVRDEADIHIGYYSRDQGDGSPFDGPGGVLANAIPPDFDMPSNPVFMHFDADEAWFLGQMPGRFDLLTVARHEIGHNLGLAHSTFPDAVMLATIGAGVSRHLSEDDIAGVRALYS